MNNSPQRVRCLRLAQNNALYTFYISCLHGSKEEHNSENWIPYLDKITIHSRHSRDNATPLRKPNGRNFETRPGFQIKLAGENNEHKHRNINNAQ